MDTLVVCLTGVCNEVEHIYAERVVNAATRRDPLQKKSVLVLLLNSSVILLIWENWVIET